LRFGFAGSQGEATAAIAAGQEPTATLIHEAPQPQGQRSPSVGSHVQHMQQQRPLQVQRADSVRSPPRAIQAPSQHLDQTPDSATHRERQQSTSRLALYSVSFLFSIIFATAILIFSESLLRKLRRSGPNWSLGKAS
jgi:hypothetical protein